MGQHWLLVCAVALAADVAPEIEELARRRLSKVGVVFLEDDDAVNIQSALCAIQPVSRVIAALSQRQHRVDGVGARNLISTQVHRRNT